MKRLGSWIVIGGMLTATLLLSVPHPATSLLREPAAGKLETGVPAPLVGPRAASVIFHQQISATVLRPEAGGSLLRPSWFAYDSADLTFYVAEYPSFLEVVPYNSGSPYVSANYSIGSDPFAVAVDTTTGDVFVTNNASNNVSVISVAESKVVGSIPVGKDPLGIAFDPDNGLLYVANGGSNNLSVIDGATFALTSPIPVGESPVGIAFDPVSGQLFVADSGSGAVSIVSAATDSVAATVPVGEHPYGVALDNLTDDIYVSNEWSGNVSVLSAATDTLVATVPVLTPFGGSPLLEGLAYDASDGYVWVGAGSYFTVVIDPASESVIAFSDVDPSGVVYDPDSGAVCVTDTANVTFACFESTSGWTPAKDLTFTESGLPSGTLWNVTLGYEDRTQSSRTPNLTFALDSYDLYGSLSYSIGPTDRYAPDPATGVLNATLLPTTVAVSFVWSPGPYSVGFEETGLPSGTSWSVSLDGSVESSTGSSVTFTEPSGTYQYRILAIPDWHQTSLPNPGEIAVAGASVTAPTMVFVPTTYQVNFSESGLASGTVWSVTIEGDTPTSTAPSNLSFWETNGTYAYRVGPVPGFETAAAGNVTVAGVQLQIRLAFIPGYLVTFGEAGLPAGTEWNVSLGGFERNSTSDEIVFEETNGTYPFVVEGAPGYAGDPPTGTVVVAGGSTSQGITFTPVPSNEFPVTFTETGLPAGIGWSVTVANRTLSIDETLGAVAPDPITFELPNGTYSWGVYVPAGYSSGIPAGPLVVEGAPTHPAALKFTLTGGTSMSPDQLPWVWVAAGIGLAAGATAGGVSWVMRRRGARPPD
ncbi:MAG: YncE family protein [Thermoplasmata archaeon]